MTGPPILATEDDQGRMVYGEPLVKVGGQVVYACQPKQLEAIRLTPLFRDKGQDGPVHIGYGGAAGGGKSRLARTVALLVALMWPGSRTIIFRRTRPEVRDNHIVPFRSEVPDTVDGQTLYTFNATDAIATFPNVGGSGKNSSIAFGYLEKDADVFRYQGAEYDCMIFEEATHYSWFQVSWLTGNRLRSVLPYSTPFALYPSNPGNVGHAWYTRLFIHHNYREGERAEDYAFVQALVTDNDALIENDPEYLRKLDSLPEPLRSQLRYGDFLAGDGLALQGLSYEHHFVEPFPVPEHWTQFGSTDWGWSHPWTFHWYAADEDGTVFIVDSIKSRKRLPPEFHEIVANTVPLADLRYIAAGHDCWADYKARGENVPTIAEQLTSLGWKLIKANISRVSGLNNMRRYFDRTRGEPKVKLMDTPGNRAAFEQLLAIPLDPDNPEDALKVDADIFGEGGDDFYDGIRYGLASRPLKGGPEPAKPVPAEEHFDAAFDKMIQRLAKQKRRQGRA